MLKMAKHTLNVLWWLHHKIFKVYLVIFQHHAWKSYYVELPYTNFYHQGHKKSKTAAKLNN